MADDSGMARREPPDVNGRAVVGIAGGILVALLAIAFGLQLVFRDRIGLGTVRPQAFPTPAVIRDEGAERRTLEARQERDLEGARGRMPIDAAMAAIVAKGPKAFDPVAPAPKESR